MIAALFVEKGGCYYGLPDIDPWDKERDARLYAGPYPVVAHPPCQLWVNFAALNYKRYGGAHNMPGNDGGCFAAALHAVRLFGGVIEHPADSRAWEWFGLTKPWLAGGWAPVPGSIDLPRSISKLRGRMLKWTCEVWQSAYGHPARKRTWLYYVGESRPADLNWSRNPGTHQVGWFDRIKPTLSKREANATPPAFRDALISLAQNSRAETRAA